MPNDNAVDLLWTGGWDSTYRLLDIVFCHRQAVQPWYVIDRERPSTAVEIRTMGAIRRAVTERDAAAGPLVKPTRFVERSEIRPDPDLDDLFAASQLGAQYGWLPCFAKQHGLTNLELGSVAVAGGRMYSLLRRNVERCEGPAGDTFRVVAEPDDETARLFARFSFPILTYTKEDLHRRAEACGFVDLMRLTWTCHTPRRGKPCGMCTPCMVMMQTKQAWRIPPVRRIRPLLRLAKARVRRRIS